VKTLRIGRERPPLTGDSRRIASVWRFAADVVTRGRKTQWGYLYGTRDGVSLAEHNHRLKPTFLLVRLGRLILTYSTYAYGPSPEEWAKQKAKRSKT
jgi:hypothetical protein